MTEPREIDRLMVFTILSIALSVLCNLLPKDGGTNATIIANFGTLFGVLAVVLVLALATRTILRWIRSKHN